MLAPAVWRLAPGEILALAGSGRRGGSFSAASRTAPHQDRAILLGHDIVQEDQLDGTLDAAIDGLGELGAGVVCDLGHEVTKGLALGEGGAC